MNEDEDYCADNRDGVERQVHNVPNDCLGTELLEGTLDDFAQFLHRVCSRLDLTSLADNFGVSASEKGAVKDIQQRILEKIGARYEVDDGSALVQNQKNSCERCNRTVDEEQDGELWQVCEEEHATNNTSREEYQRTELRDERLPERAVGEEVEDTLSKTRCVSE